jgi:uncharacterized protein
VDRPGRSDEPAAFDASSLIFLDLLGYIPLLRQLYRVVVPEAASQELSVRSESPGSGVVSLDRVELRTPDPESVRRVGREPPNVGKGEKEAIALGLVLSCPVVLDDRKARLRARRAGLEVTGTLGILLRLRRIGLTSRGIDEDLGLLEEAGMRLSPNLRRIVIEAGKQDDGRQH